MATTPSLTAPSSAMPYVWAAVIVFLVGIILIGVVLALRPQYDPLIIVSSVMGFTLPFCASIFAFMKSQETHLTVNSQLTAWKLEHSRMDHAEGVISGTATEQARIAEQKLATATAAAAVGSTGKPLPVEVVAPVPIPVTTVKS